jgi:hypothetical protein
MLRLTGNFNTLLGGSTLGYVSAASAKTFAPEEFTEFLNQRRR